MASGWDLWSLWRLRETCKDMGQCIVQTYMEGRRGSPRLPSKTPAIHVARLGEYYKIDGYYRDAHAWIGNTRGICDYLVRSGLPANRVFYIGNFVPDPSPADETSKAEALLKYGIRQDAWVIFSLGRLVDVKGFDDLLRAMALCPGKCRQTPDVARCGRRPHAARLQADAQELGLQERVRWLGWQTTQTHFMRWRCLRLPVPPRTARQRDP